MQKNTPASQSSSPVPRIRRTQLERREESEKRLIEAAMQIVAERGVERMTLAEVGDVAGYSRGLAAHHFGNKRGLLGALVNSVATNFRDQVRAGLDFPNGMASIFGVLKLYFLSIERMPTSARAFLVLMTDSSLVGSELGDSIVIFNRESIRFIEENLQVAIDTGEIRGDVPVKSVAVLILGILRGVLLHRLVDPEKVNSQTVHAQAVIAITRLVEKQAKD